MPDVTRDRIEACLYNCHPNKPLTPWELNFIESVAEQYEAKGRLSEKQEEILERIYAQKTK